MPLLCRWLLLLFLCLQLCDLSLSAKASRGGGGGGGGGVGKGSGGSKKDGGGKSSSVVAIPRSKSKGGGGKSTGSMRSFGGGLVYNLFREMKQAFGSELEALTLQLTRPSDAAVPASSLEELVQVFNVEYENPQLTVSLFAKFSRKLCEQNVYTKIKSLLCLHKLMQGAEDKAACAMMQCVRTLRSEMDAKVGLPFFSNESIEQSASVAANVGELEAVELTIEYASYVFDLIEARGDKISTKGSSSKNSGSTADRAEALLSLIEQGQAIEGLCKQRTTGPLLKQCLDSIKTDRNWALKSLQYVSESGGADDEKIDEEIAATLALFDVKTKRKEKKEKGGRSSTSATSSSSSFSSPSSSSSSFFEQPRKAPPKKAKTQIVEEKKQEVKEEEEEEEEEAKGKTTQLEEEKVAAPQESESDTSAAKATTTAATVAEPIVENIEVEALEHAASLPSKKSTKATASASSASPASSVKKTKTKAKVQTSSIKKKKSKGKGKTGNSKKTKKQ